MKKLAWSLSCSAVLLLSGVAVATPAVAQEKLTVGIIELFSGEFFTEARKGYQVVADRENLELLIENGDGDAAKEAEIIETFITRQVDVIMVATQSPTGSLAALRQAKEAGIPVVCFDTCVSPPDDKELVQAFVTSDNRGLGLITGGVAANYIRDTLGGKANIVMLTCATFDVCKERRLGFDEAMAGLDITVLDEQEGFQVDTARPLADAMLTAHPNADVFVAFNDGAAIAAGQAVVEAGLLGKTPVFAIDVNPQVAAMIVDPNGAIVWTTGQDPFSMGRVGVEAAVQAARGETIENFYQFTPSPTYSKEAPNEAQQYIDTH